MSPPSWPMPFSSPCGRSYERDNMTNQEWTPKMLAMKTITGVEAAGDRTIFRLSDGSALVVYGWFTVTRAGGVVGAAGVDRACEEGDDG